MVNDELSGFDKRARELIKGMQACGWTGRRTSKGHWLGKAPDGTTITVPPKMDKANRAGLNSEAQFARWLRAQAPEEMENLEFLINDAPVGPATEVMREKALKVASSAILSKVGPIEEPVSTPKLIEEVEVQVPERVLVTTRPWLARRKAGKAFGERYESEAVVENHYSDGSVEYSCAFGCGYVSDKPRSVANHYGSHTRQRLTEPAGEGPRHVDVTYTEPTFQRAYNPQERLVKALTAFLEEHWTGDLDMDEIATMFLTWAHERPDLEHVERDVAAYTDTEMVQRIRMIVGQPFSVELKEAKERLSELQALVDERTRERDEQAARLVKVQRDLDAIKEMLGGIGS